MGTKVEFTCTRCGYRAEVSGGKDCGMFAVVETMTCNSCRELVDVLIGKFGREGPVGEPEFDDTLGRCPNCGGKDAAPWGGSYPCPKCGARMEPGSEPVLWD